MGIQISGCSQKIAISGHTGPHIPLWPHLAQVSTAAPAVEATVPQCPLPS